MGNTEATNGTGNQPEPVDKNKTEQIATDGHSAGKNEEDKRAAILQMTQLDLDTIVGERARRAKKTAISDLLGELGVENADELKAVFEAHKAAQEAEKTDLQKAQEAKTAAEAQTIAAQKERDNLLIQNAIMEQAPTHNVPADRFAALYKLMDLSDISIKEGAVTGVDEAIKAAVEANPFLLFIDGGDEKAQQKGTPFTRRQSQTKKTPPTPEEKAKGWRGRKSSL